ncbi:alpha/beta fold hydrolase [Gordonia sp. KTR9]|uniref:alpha/beta fold hydrolase n=1 Tax=Gordonia sp. KTR9 TaxID=337191 RepID=UPI00027DDEA0|nr:alpha/beta hydrolase [Gordonia sp. KTR9]AFR49467.1 putative hydrolase or acyltransferase, alpha/beta hydrolase-like protein [Gordonia sp. KTR9]
MDNYSSATGRASSVALELCCEGTAIRGEHTIVPQSYGDVVFVHGGGQTRHSWRRTARRVASAGWSTLAFDLRGHGESDWAPDGDYSTDAMIADLRAVVGQLSRPPVVVGASLGGLLAVLLDGEGHETVRAIVLVDVVPRVDEAGALRVMEFMAAHREGFRSLDAAADAIAVYNPHRPRASSTDGLRRILRWREDRWHWHWDPSFLPDPPARRTDPDRVAAAARKVTVPTLAVRGAHSDIVTEQGLRDLAALIPHAQVEVVDAGHMVVGDDNATFDEQLPRFLLTLHQLSSR